MPTLYTEDRRISEVYSSYIRLNFYERKAYRIKFGIPIKYKG